MFSVPAFADNPAPKAFKNPIKVCAEGSIRDRILIERYNNKTNQSVGLILRWSR